MTGAVRRARPALGTIVEVGVVGARDPGVAIAGAYAAIADVERALSRQRHDSELTRLNAAAPFARVAVGVHMRAVLACAHALFAQSGGTFDIACGTAPREPGFALDATHAWRTSAGARLSLDGIAKGYAVDCAIDALAVAGAAAGWVNAGGDLRAFGALDLPVVVRIGRAWRNFVVRERALATSEFGRARRVGATSTLGRARGSAPRAASVMATRCMVADALTKVAALDARRARTLAPRLGAHVLVAR